MENLIISDEELNFIANNMFIEEYPHLLDTLDEPKFSINDLKIQPRDATYWDKQGVLPKIKGTGMRRKYDLVQSIWIKLVQQMRSLGISLATIQLLKDNFLEPKIDLDEIDPSILKRFFDKLNDKTNESFSLEEFHDTLKQEEISIFKSIVIATIIFRKPLLCLVNKDGDYYLYDSNKHQEYIQEGPDFVEFISHPYFCISFSDAFKTLVHDWSPIESFSDYSLLSDSELQILSNIRKQNINSITIRYKDGAPFLIEVSEQSKITMEQRFLDVISKNGYQSITIKTQNGKITNFENKILIKLKQSTT